MSRKKSTKRNLKNEGDQEVFPEVLDDQELFGRAAEVERLQKKARLIFVESQFQFQRIGKQMESFESLKDVPPQKLLLEVHELIMSFERLTSSLYRVHRLLMKFG